MLNFFQNAEISIDYDFEHIEIPQNYQKVAQKNYIFISPYGQCSKNYVSSPFEERSYKEEFKIPDSIGTISDIGQEYEEDTDDDIRLSDFEIQLLENCDLTETIFYSDGQFETNLPTGEIYENKFEDIAIAPYYLEELSNGFEDINGFEIEYYDKTTDSIKKWVVVYDKDEEEYHLHGKEGYSEQVDNTYKGNKTDFKTMIKAIIQNSVEHELRSATFYQ